MIEFAIKHREFLFAVDAAACGVMAVCAGYLMAVVARVSDRRTAIGLPWPRGLEMILRIALGLGATVASLVPAIYWAGQVHFVLIEEVIIHASIAVIGVILVVYRRPLFGPYSA